MSVAQLEPAPQEKNPWQQPVPDHPGPVETDRDTAESQYKIEKIVRTRQRKTRAGYKTQYLVRWLGWGPEWDEWINTEDMNQAQELIQEFEA